MLNICQHGTQFVALLVILCASFDWYRQMTRLQPVEIIVGDLSQTKSYSRDFFVADIAGLELEIGVPDNFLRMFWAHCMQLKRSKCDHLILVPYDSIRGLTVQSQICSFKQHGLIGNHVLFVALDRVAYERATSLGMKTLLFQSTKELNEHAKYMCKLVLSIFTLKMDLTCYLVDSDVILLGDFYELWDGNVDLEFASDSAWVLESKNFNIRRNEVNTGLIKMRPTTGIIKLVLNALLSGRGKRRGDQDFINKELHASRRNGAYWTSARYDIIWGVIEPVKAPTGGVLFCQGKESMKQFAKKRGVASPLVAHLNYHVPGKAKGRTTRLLRWKMANGKCPTITWPYWTTEALPSEVTCRGPYVRDFDPWDQ